MEINGTVPSLPQANVSDAQVKLQKKAGDQQAEVAKELIESATDTARSTLAVA